MTSTNSSQVKPTRSPEQHHQRQVTWQIALPLGLILALFIASAVLVVLYTTGYIPEAGLPDQQSPLAKSSAILLVSGTCLGSLFQLLLLVGLVLLTGKMIKGLPGVAHKVQDALVRTSTLAGTISEKLASPVISVASFKAALSQLVKSIKFWNKPVEEKTILME